MSVGFNAYTFPRSIRYVTTPAALGLLPNGPLTIITWISTNELFLGDGSIAVMADDGGHDSWNLRRQLSGRLTNEMIVDEAFNNAFIGGLSLDTWYFAEAYATSNVRSMRVNNGAPNNNFNILGTMTPFTTLEILVGADQSSQFFGCLAEVALLNRELTDGERATLSAGVRPPNVLGLSNIAFYCPLVDAASALDAYIYGTPVTMSLVNLSPVACADAPPLIEGTTQIYNRVMG
jgi:Concanavalin A-like lectin/glucanases superfamily